MPSLVVIWPQIKENTGETFCHPSAYVISKWPSLRRVKTLQHLLISYPTSFFNVSNVEEHLVINATHW